MPFRVLAVIFLALAIAACGTSRGRKGPIWPYPDEPTAPSPSEYPPAPSQPLPREPIPGMPSPVPQPLPAPGGMQSYPKSAEDISGAAVLSLIRQARQHRDAGDSDQAVAALERAMRIEPRNYFVWSALAQAQLQQKNYEQAESVAQKSNSLARGNLYVELENWKTIARARTGRGDAAGADQAQGRVADIERVLEGQPGAR